MESSFETTRSHELPVPRSNCPVGQTLLERSVDPCFCLPFRPVGKHTSGKTMMTAAQALGPKGTDSTTSSESDRGSAGDDDESRSFVIKQKSSSTSASSGTFLFDLDASWNEKLEPVNQSQFLEDDDYSYSSTSTISSAENEPLLIGMSISEKSINVAQDGRLSPPLIPLTKPSTLNIGNSWNYFWDWTSDDWVVFDPAPPAAKDLVHASASASASASPCLFRPIRAREDLKAQAKPAARSFDNTTRNSSLTDAVSSYPIPVCEMPTQRLVRPIPLLLSKSIHAVHPPLYDETIDGLLIRSDRILEAASSAFTAPLPPTLRLWGGARQDVNGWTSAFDPIPEADDDANDGNVDPHCRQRASF